MKLPTIDQPLYEVKLLSIQNPVKFRPFLVKEQKIMMMAVEAGDLDTTMRAIKQIISNCVIDKLNVDDLPLADIETLFLHLRARSMGEVMNTYFKCNNKIVVPNAQTTNSQGLHPVTTECGMIIEVPVNLLEVKQLNADTPTKIMLTDSVGVKMKYPSISVVDKLVNANDSSVIFTLVASCIDQVFDKDGVYNSKDATFEEMLSYVETLPTDAFEKLEDFVEKVPKAHFERLQKCGKCGFEHKFVLEGISDFFT